MKNMKKILWFVFAFMFAIVPFCKVEAATSITGENPPMYSKNDDGTFSSRAHVTIKGDGIEEIVVKVKEIGAAKLDETSVKEGSGDWSIVNSSFSESDRVLTVTLKSTEPITGEHTLFTFDYSSEGDGTEECKIDIEYPTIENKEPTPAPTPDTPEENKQTGSSLPYIALGALVLVAGGAYVATRNKSKMYKI